MTIRLLEDQRPQETGPARNLDARHINRLGRELAAIWTQYADLLAAARATLTASRDGDPYALEFLADELVVQHGQLDLDDETARVRRSRPWAEIRWWEVGR